MKHDDAKANQDVAQAGVDSRWRKGGDEMTMRCEPCDMDVKRRGMPSHERGKRHRELTQRPRRTRTFTLGEDRTVEDILDVKITPMDGYAGKTVMISLRPIRDTLEFRRLWRFVPAPCGCKIYVDRDLLYCIPWADRTMCESNSRDMTLAEWLDHIHYEHPVWDNMGKLIKGAGIHSVPVRE